MHKSLIINKGKYCAVLLCIILFSSNLLYSKEYPDYSKSSGISSIILNEQVTNDLEVVCKVWGYVKYHHPAFVDNTYNLDYELFDLIHSIQRINSKAERDSILADWIDGFGSYKVIQNKSEFDIVDSLSIRNLSISWISDTGFLNKKLSDKLIDLRYAQREDENQFVTFSPSDVPNFEKDSLYSNLMELDCGQRLLALFRYWNIIEYYFPYKYLMNNNWEQTLRKYIPIFINANNHTLYLSSCFQLQAEIDDTHAFSTNFFWFFFGNKVAAIQMRFIGERLIITDVKQNDLTASELRAGDEVIQIGDKTLDERMQIIRKHTSKSNENVFLRDAALVLGFTREDTVDITFKRGQDTCKTKVSTLFSRDYSSWIKTMNPYVFGFLEDSIGYIEAGKVDMSNANDVIEVISKANALIVDLRCSSSIEFYQIAMDLLVPNNTEFALYTSPVKKMPGVFKQKRLRTQIYDGTKFHGKIVVLVDEATQSHLEFLTMLLQSSSKVTVIGSQTAGADGNVTYVYLPAKITSVFSSIGVYYPNGQETQRVGVSIDKVITLIYSQKTGQVQK
ncbi:MAG: S41 family peptidase [Bacteroidales bacterium]|nr:S41 family peptidase [Bacteroidales bacterium]